MSQTARYVVAIGLRHGGSFASTPQTVMLPGNDNDPVQVEQALSERMQTEYRAARTAGSMFDLEQIGEEDTTRKDWGCLAGRDDPWVVAGRLAVAAEEIAWIQVMLEALEPEQPEPPATGDAGGLSGGTSQGITSA